MLIADSDVAGWIASQLCAIQSCLWEGQHWEVVKLFFFFASNVGIVPTTTSEVCARGRGGGWAAL